MIDTLTHARTLQQPIAWAVASGHCPIINSPTRPPLEAVGKLIGIHAGRQQTQADPSDPMADWARAQPDYRLHLGALIGVARLVGVLHVRDGLYRVMRGNSVDVTLVDQTLVARIRPWWRGPYGWLWSNEPGDEPLLLQEPVPMRGQQGLWRIDTAVVQPCCQAAGCRAHVAVSAASWALEQWRKARETR